MLPGSPRFYTGVPKAIGFGIAWIGTFAWMMIVGGIMSLMGGISANEFGNEFGSDTANTVGALVIIAALATIGLAIFVLVSVIQMAAGNQDFVTRGMVGAGGICLTAFLLWVGFGESGVGVFVAIVLAFFGLVGFLPFFSTSGKVFFHHAHLRLTTTS